jgi:hypothetical protein
MITHLWHNFLALHPARYAVYLLVIGLGLLKRKAIAAAARVATNAVTSWFWNAVRKRVLPGSHSNGKTYRGTFYAYGQYENYPHECFFRLVHEGVATTVPVMRTNLLTGVQPGSFVEIDTQVLPGAKVEVVRRVRVRAQ